ncbi:hypothetical protein KUV57_13575 [Epibacterium sp. DP7N7-1]|nr:hypothetical protein [Epibacterium sp. DP7N7-1]
MQKRPTWQSGEKTYPALFPAADLDPEAAMAAAKEIRIMAYGRSKDVLDFLRSAAAFHMQASATAYVDLACKVRDGKAQAPEGWSLHFTPSPKPNHIGLILENNTGPGGYLVSIATQAAMTEVAEEAAEDLKRAVEEELSSLGYSNYEIMMRDIIGPKDPIGTEQELARIRADPKSYRGMEPGDVFDDMVITALDISGPPADLDAENASTPEVALNADVRAHYIPGKIFRMAVDYEARRDGMLVERSGSEIDLGTETALTVISKLLDSNGYGPRISGKASSMSKHSWIHYGLESDAPISEAAHAAVFSSNGLFDAAVLDRVIEFVQAIAAHDLSIHEDEFLALADGLIEYGYVSRETAFDANDMRDWGHAVRKDQIVSLFDRTENGTYRLDLHLADDEDGKRITRAEAFTVSSSPIRLICRFDVREGGEWVPDYGADIPYTARNTKDVNNMIRSLESLSCVFVDEVKARPDNRAPGL